jgi:hypothetical protein
MTASAVGFARGAVPYTGQISALDGDRVGVVLRDPAGHVLYLDLRLRIDDATGSVTGILRGGPPGSVEAGPSE